MKKLIPVILILPLCIFQAPGQGSSMRNSAGVLFNGLVMDSETRTPLQGTQIFINRKYSSASDREGKFAFILSGHDTVTFTRLGYRMVNFYMNDSLTGKEFIAGVFMNSDTVQIGEVVIIPRLSGLRRELMSPSPPAGAETEYARYNLAVSSYQARVGQGRLGNPDANFYVLRQKQMSDAYSKGQIPPDQIMGLSPLMLIPAAYLLMNGLPEKPGPYQPRLTEQEISQIHKRYMELHKGN